MRPSASTWILLGSLLFESFLSACVPALPPAPRPNPGELVFVGAHGERFHDRLATKHFFPSDACDHEGIHHCAEDAALKASGAIDLGCETAKLHAHAVNIGKGSLFLVEGCAQRATYAESWSPLAEEDDVVTLILIAKTKGA